MVFHGFCSQHVCLFSRYGALVSYPLMRWFCGLDVQQWYYYVPFCTPSAVVGGAMGVAVLLILKRGGVLGRMLAQLDA